MAQDTICSIIIPVASYHVDIASRAIGCAEAQTVPCEVIALMDTDGVGAGAMRNRGAAQANSPFVFWLDADDTITPTCIERCLHYWKPRYYVYPDAVVNNARVNFPDCGQNTWKEGAVHLVSALVPLSFHYAIGGFDETLAGMEDTEYYVHLLAQGYCGLRCPEPHILYDRHKGQRSRSFMSGAGNYDALNHELVRRYGRYSNMGCCGGGTGKPANKTAENTPQAGDVLVEANYAPRRMTGWATGRNIPRAGNGDRLWIAKADYEKMQDLFTLISDPEGASPDFGLVQSLINGSK